MLALPRFVNLKREFEIKKNVEMTFPGWEFEEFSHLHQRTNSHLIFGNKRFPLISKCQIKGRRQVYFLDAKAVRVERSVLFKSKIYFI